MKNRLNEIAENISDRMSELRAVMEILSEDRDTYVSEKLFPETVRMYQRLSEISDELDEAGRDVNDK